MRTIGNGRSSVALAVMSTIGATGSVKLFAAAGLRIGRGVGLRARRRSRRRGRGRGRASGWAACGAGTTTAVVTDCWLIESTVFFSVIRTPSRKPRSAVVTTYFAAVASAIASHDAARGRTAAPLVLHGRCRVARPGGRRAVSVAPTTASPWTAGGDVNAGGASAPSASVGHSSSAAAANETRSAGHVRRLMAKLCKTSPLRLSARTVLPPLRSARARTGLSSGPRGLNAPSDRSALCRQRTRAHAPAAARRPRPARRR